MSKLKNQATASIDQKLHWKMLPAALVAKSYPRICSQPWQLEAACSSSACSNQKTLPRARRGGNCKRKLVKTCDFFLQTEPSVL